MKTVMQELVELRSKHQYGFEQLGGVFVLAQALLFLMVIIRSVY